MDIRSAARYRLRKLLSPRSRPQYWTADRFARHRPWIDGSQEDFEAGLAHLKLSGAIDATDEARLGFFREHGYLLMEGAVSHRLIDKLLEDIDEAWRDLPPQFVLNNTLEAPALMEQVAGTPGMRSSSMRYLDFHNVSEAALEITMLPVVLRFAEACFGESIAAMQSLLFENGTQQRSHQDFAFVHSLRPPCLMGAWVALEDVHPDAGPLFYWDRSHRLVPKYVFEGGSVLAEGDGAHVRAFEDYLENTCRDLELMRLTFTPHKGDVLIWHSALVHGGTPRTNPALTRKSIVSHYTTRRAYPFDRRHAGMAPLVRELHGAVYYEPRREGHIEGRYPLESSRGSAA
ncbi:MAG TPA: phytanoyl-CoA dioxygenase family protein [Rhodanobacteraceae bacterium]|jgi:ectoine hydroxylase-related dioxygenase (phytanoyl-CoA dioxygenase family)|nr:phytanoyl-CoA dioxygenase family protein [Rhodanobacteraceae bacterium]